MKHLFRILSLALVLAVALGAFALAEGEKAAEYLEAYYGIAPFEGEVSLDAFNAALEAVGAPAIEGDALTMENAVQAAVRLAGMEELALTYINDDAPDKVKDVLADAGIEVAEEYAPYMACAIDMGLIDLDEPFVAEAVATLLYDALAISDRARNAIGRVFDNDILYKLSGVLNAFIIFDDEQLTELGTEIVLRGATTGYNLKYAGFDANFLDKYTLKYGHSDVKHAMQLVALLNSEGIDAWIQIEPKVSVYEYMIEWGEPGEPTPTYAVLQVSDDRYLCYAVEYDMMLEFDSTEDKEAFHDIIETYAKKYDDSFDEEGNLTEKLLDGSWWQPLYSSTTEMENEEFGLLYDNVVYDADGLFSIHPFSLPENQQAIADVVAEVAPELSVSPVAIYVNPAFMRYITGEDYQ